METPPPQPTRPVRAPDLARWKQQGRRVAMLTAYDASMARLLDESGIDVLLVGDSLGMVVMGYETTLPVTLEEVEHHTRAVARGARRALVVADMPFLTYQVSLAETVRNAGRLIRAGAAAVKLEGGRPVADAVKRLVEVGIPVMGHLGLTPQALHRLGGFRRQARQPGGAEQLLADAHALEDAGAFALVVEMIPSDVARMVTADLKIPTVGIGAGPHCDGQVLVHYDAFGLYPGAVPRFVRQYARLGDEMREAARRYADEVRRGEFPPESTE